MDASTVCRFMRPDPPTAHEDESLQNVIEMIVKEKIDGIPIVDKNRCVRGLITRVDYPCSCIASYCPKH